MRVSHLVAGIIATVFAFGCDQYDPSPEHKLFRQESTNANKPTPKLTEKGELPVVEEVKEEVADVDPIEQKYQTFCASCHGADGAANSATAMALNPRPRNFTDKAWQDKTSDDRIYKVLKEGGASVGLAATMASFGTLLTDEEIKGMIGKIRSFAK